MYSTPLHRSLELAKDYNISRVLIENGADLCNRNVNGETPLHTHFSSVIEQVLLIHAYLFDYTVCDGSGKTLLHHLAWSSKTSRELFEQVNARSGCMNRIVDKDQRSLLHQAAQRGNLAILKYILTNLNVNINVKDKIGRTPLHYAIESSRAQETIELLISNGANTSAQDYEGSSALRLAEKRGKKLAIRAFGLSNEFSTKNHRAQIRLQKVQKHSKIQKTLSVLTPINLHWRDWWVSDMIPGFGNEVLKKEMDLEGPLKDIEKKESDFPASLVALKKLLSRQIASSMATMPCKTLKLLSYVVLLYGIWLF